MKAISNYIKESESVLSPEEIEDLTIRWSDSVENAINDLEEYANKILPKEKDEFGIASNAFHEMIMVLKYYYDKKKFDKPCYSTIEKFVVNHDWVGDEKIDKALETLKKSV